MIDRETAEKIKDAANIVDVVGEFVTLHKSGANYKGLCPFHNEKTLLRMRPWRQCRGLHYGARTDDLSRGIALARQ